jgi:branched-chain amino acid aminotransferase
VLLASLDGEIAAPDQTRIPVTDEGLLRGDGAFEVIRVYDGRPFALEDHYARLEGTAKGLRLEADLPLLRREVTTLLDECSPGDCLLRIVLTRGGRRLAMLEPLPARLQTARVKSITYAPTRVLTQLKTLSYAGNMLAGRLAQEQGYDEALLVTPHGRVLEGPTWTFFWVSGGELLTPPLSDHVLASITRARILDCHGGSERACTLDDVRAADEAFIASTVREAMPIAVVDDIELPEAPGPVTRAVQDALTARIRDELAAGAAAA